MSDVAKMFVARGAIWEALKLLRREPTDEKTVAAGVKILEHAIATLKTREQYRAERSDAPKNPSIEGQP